MTANLSIEASPIPGLVVVHLPLNQDARGWFKENWQREKMVAEGLPDFRPVQNNISFNALRGVTRGFHAEPWSKYVSVGAGSVFGAWIDLREGPNFGTTFTYEISPQVAVFVPRGVANAFQTLEPNTVYTYLVTDHWRTDASYVEVSLADPALEISWPIPLAEATVSAKDLSNVYLRDVAPFEEPRVVVLGSGGQLGKELESALHNVTAYSRAEIDIRQPAEFARLAQSAPSAIVNAAAFTQVDFAESAEGRALAWAVNAEGAGHVADLCNTLDIPLVHISSDYVFDGSKPGQYSEDDVLSPLGVYGQTKAAGDLAAARARRHYLLRPSWVIGDGRNFVKTMVKLARQGAQPRVVADQFGRPTFTSELRRAIEFLFEAQAPYGLYNVTNSGDIVSWADLAAEVFHLVGADRGSVIPVTTQEYLADRAGSAPRPANSALGLEKISSLGFVCQDWREPLAQYVEGLLAQESDKT